MSIGTRIGVFIDCANISMNGGKGMRFDVLREFACRGGAECVRLNAYVAFDAERAKTDATFRQGQMNFHSMLRDFGYKVIEKRVKWYTDDTGTRYGKANVDLDMAVDALLQSESLDRVLLATGDGDFTQVVRALQDKGCRVEVVGFESVSQELRREADLFASGYLIPNLLPTAGGREGGTGAGATGNGSTTWGAIGSRVRGVCYHHGAGFGFLRFMKHISPALYKTDTREADSPYQSAFFHDGQLPEDISYTSLPSRDIIFEFTIQRSDQDESKLAVSHMELVSPRRGT